MERFMDILNNSHSDLIEQLKKLARHNRHGSYATRERYFDAGVQFCSFLETVYHLKSLRNIAPKHIVAYVQDMQARGLTPSTIKTNLSAIRMWHDLIPRARYRLPSNEELGITMERRKFGGVDRTWSEEEVRSMCQIAEELGHHDYAVVLFLADRTGLRLHEVLRIDTATARTAVKTGRITIRGKGGRQRTVPVKAEVKAVLRSMLEVTRPGCKLFVRDGEQAHDVQHRIEGFVSRHRAEAGPADREAPLTVHGLRHSYAKEEYLVRIAQGEPSQQAKREVSNLLGHNRPDVTNIYLASIREDVGDDEDDENNG